jgi:hypothetical protein
MQPDIQIHRRLHPAAVVCGNLLIKDLPSASALSLLVMLSGGVSSQTR